MEKQINIDTDALKAAAPIIDYIKKYYPDKIKIERETNTTATAKCIFHQEDTASLTFFSNGSWKCFGCGEHGDLITLVQKIENIDFQSACVKIANNVGFPIAYVNVNPAWEKYKDNLDDHTRRYWVNLHNDPAQVAMNYLKNERHLSDDTITKFRLGFTDYEEYKFRNDIGNISYKIAFPILEHKRYRPKCVGMAYRGLTDDKPKYVNDHNQVGVNGQDPALSGVFVKGNMLYGLAQAYNGIAKFKFVFVTEGYFDVLSMHQAGFTNTVAIMGTSFTEAQMSTLYSLTNNLYLLLDNDKAGHEAINKYIPILVSYGFNVMICNNKNNPYKDPDQICIGYNYDFHRLYNLFNSNAIDAVHYLIQNETEQFLSVVSKERIKVCDTLQPIIDSVKNPATRMAYQIELNKIIS